MSGFTPTGRMIIHTDWDIRPEIGHRGATTGHVYGRAVNVATGKFREVHGTETQVMDWAFELMTRAGEHGIAVELRDARG